MVQTIRNTWRRRTEHRAAEIAEDADIGTRLGAVEVFLFGKPATPQGVPRQVGFEEQFGDLKKDVTKIKGDLSSVKAGVDILLKNGNGHT